MDWYIGTMGFSYSDWAGVFYPTGSASRNYLSYYSQHFNAAEIDSTFYGTPRPGTVQRWDAITPEGFKICAKTPKIITHELRLVNAMDEMRLFLGAMSELGEKLGIILIQFPPSYALDEFPALASFLSDLPGEFRYAVEFRNRSWYTPETAELLSENNICWTATEYARLPKKVEVTTDFLYIRFIGQHRRFAQHNRVQIEVGASLDWWLKRIESLSDKVGEVYGFFNNDYSGFAPATADRFKSMAGLPADDSGPPRQERLF